MPINNPFFLPITTSLFDEEEQRQILIAKEKYLSLRDLYNQEEDSLAKALADLILTEDMEAEEEITQVVSYGKEAVDSLIQLIVQYDFYNPLFPGYGMAPAYAAKRLGLLKDPKALPALFSVIGKVDFLIEEAVLDALRQIGPGAQEFLIKVLLHRPFTKENENAAIALLSFRLNNELAEVFLQALSIAETHQRPQLMSYLILGCEGSISADGKSAYLTDRFVRKVYKIDLTSFSVVGAASNDSFIIPYGIAITPDSTSAYITDSQKGTLDYIDIASNTVIGSINSNSFISPQGIAITPDGKYAYVTDPKAKGDKVSKIDINTNQIVGTIQDNRFRTPQNIAITPNGNYAYITDTIAGYIYQIDLMQDVVIGVVGNAVFNDPFGIAITPNGQYAYATDLSTAQVYQIDIATNQVIGTVSGETFHYPYHLAITPDNQYLFLTDTATDLVYKIDISTNQVVALLSGALLSYPYSLAIAPSVIDTVTPIIEIEKPEIMPEIEQPLITGPTILTGGLTVSQKRNDFGLEYERFNKLKWKAVSGAMGYWIYRDGVLIATVPSSKLKYNDHNRIKAEVVTYTVIAIDVSGNQTIRSSASK